MVDQRLAEQHDRHERRAQRGELQRADAAHAARPSPVRRAHSSRPRRIASATAAARSETPSFSYRRAWWVLTVGSAMISRSAICGPDASLRHQRQHLALARGQDRPVLGRGARSGSGRTRRPGARARSPSPRARRRRSRRGSPGGRPPCGSTPRRRPGPRGRRARRRRRPTGTARASAARRARTALRTCETVELGQPQVEHRDPRAQLADALERLAPVGRGSDQLEVRPLAHGALDPLAEQRVIVGHHDLHARGRHTGIIPHAGRLVDRGDDAHVSHRLRGWSGAATTPLGPVGRDRRGGSRDRSIATSVAVRTALRHPAIG